MIGTFAEQNGFAKHVFGAGFDFWSWVRRFFHKHSIHPCVAHTLKRPQSLLILLVWIIVKMFCRRKMKQNFPQAHKFTCITAQLKQNKVMFTEIEGALILGM